VCVFVWVKISCGTWNIAQGAFVTSIQPGLARKAIREMDASCVLVKRIPISYPEQDPSIGFFPTIPSIETLLLGRVE
jgi:hypothetical protein